MKLRIVFLLAWIFLSQHCFSNPTLEDFLEERTLMAVEISPDGKHLAQLWNKDGAHIVTVRDLTQKNSPIIGTISDKMNRPQAITWANDERLIVTVWIPFDISYAERMSKKPDFDVDDYVAYTRLMSADINLKNQVMLLNDNRSAKANYNLGRATFISKDRQHVLMTAWEDDRLTLYKVDVNTGKSQKLIKAGTKTFLFLCDDSGEPLYRLDYLRFAKAIDIFQKVNDQEWTRIDTIRLKDLESEDALKELELVSLSKDDLIYRRKNDETGFYELVKYNREQKKIEPYLSLKDADIIAPITNHRSREIIGYISDGDHYRRTYFDAEKQKRYDKLLTNFKDYDFNISSITDDGKTGIVEVSGIDTPLTYYSYNSESGEVNSIGAAYPSISSDKLGTFGTVNYAARDGKKIHSFVLFPPNYQAGTQYPLIVMPHGEPQARDRADYDDFAQFLSTRGYIVIKPNFRGSTGFGKEFEEAGYKQWGQLMQNDVDDAVSFMLRKGYADSKKISILGFSYGGYSALMGALKRPDLYSCAVSINGVTHLRDLIESDRKDVDDPAIFEKYWIQRIGSPTADKQMLDENSPALQAENFSIPLLLIASEKDDIVPFSQSKTLAKALEKSKKKYTFIRLEKSGHTPFYDKKESETVHKEVEKFLEAHLK